MCSACSKTGGLVNLVRCDNGYTGTIYKKSCRYKLMFNMRQVQPETLPKNSNFSSCLQNICYLKLYSWRLWISCGRRSQWMRMRSGKWLKIRCYSLWVRDFPFHCFIFIWKQNRLDVYCSVFLLFSRCIDHFICYSRIVYIGDSLGHVICLLIYFQLAVMLMNILKCIN